MNDIEVRLLYMSLLPENPSSWAMTMSHLEEEVSLKALFSESSTSEISARSMPSSLQSAPLGRAVYT
jgi:hypothetical protein